MAPRKAKSHRRNRVEGNAVPAITVVSDLELPEDLMGWERELLLPVVSSVVVDMIEELNSDEDGGP